MNKIIVIGPPDSRNRAAKILELLDQQPKQIYLAVVIGQLTLGDGVEAGVDYLIHTDNLKVLGQGTAANLSNLIQGRNATIDVVPGTSNVVSTAANAATTATQAAGTALPILSGLTCLARLATPWTCSSTRWERAINSRSSPARSLHRQ